MYLFDADSLILANRHDFPINKDPGTFWQFIEEMGNAGKIRIPEAVFDEITRKDDNLSSWLSARKPSLFLPTHQALPHLSQVLGAYGSLTDIQLEALNGKADPFLIAHALAIGATVITNEISRPNVTNPLNKKIPDICACLEVSCLRYPRFLCEMKHHTP